MKTVSETFKQTVVTESGRYYGWDGNAFSSVVSLGRIAPPVRGTDAKTARYEAAKARRGIK